MIGNFMTSSTEPLFLEDEAPAIQARGTMEADFLSIKSIQYSPTAKGYPSLWEYGGSTTNVGKAQVIGDPSGKQRRPLFVRSVGHMANGEHALFAIERGDLIARAVRSRERFMVRVWRIEQLDTRSNRATLILEYSDDGEENVDLRESRFYQIVEAAKQKSLCYHCRHVHFSESMHNLDDDDQSIAQ